MRFGLWAAAKEEEFVPEPTVETKNVSRKQETKKKGNDDHHVSGRKERGRYEIPEPMQKPVQQSKEKGVMPGNVNELREHPLIDRIPTALGYLSDGSDEEWLEEKSRCSRYNVSNHGSDDELDEPERDEEDERDDNDLEESGDDKYSQNGRMMKTKTTKIQHDTISALWSHSTDSETDNSNWKTNDCEKMDEMISYKDDQQSAEPIYDKNQKHAAKINKRKPSSPAGISDTSSMSDNIVKMLHFAQSNEQQVSDDVEKNVKILQTVASESHGQPSKEKKKSPEKGPRKFTNKSKQPVVKALKSKDEIELSRSITMAKARSKDDIELSRSVSHIGIEKQVSTSPSLIRTFTNNLFMKKKSFDINNAIVAENTTPSGEDLSEEESVRSGRPSRAMYTKSLLTEDSDNDDTVLQSTILDANKSNNATVAARVAEVNGRVDSKKHRIGILLSNSWGLGGKLRSKQGDGTEQSNEKKSSRGFFWKKRDRIKTTSVENKDTSAQHDVILPEGLNSPRSKGSKEPQELDEYSKSTKEPNVNEPDIVQCLRFFQCGSVANNVNVAITVANCGKAEGNDGNDDDEEECLDVNPLTPKPTVEVYIENEKNTTKVRNGIDQSCGSSMSCKNDSSNNDDIVSEGLPIGLTRANSIIVDVTSMQLHLDGATETRHKNSSVRAVGGSQSKSDVSVTSIVVPNQETPQVPDEVERQEATEMVLKEYVNKESKRKRVVSFFKKLWKRE